jgi:Cu-processing system permease protein
MASKVLALVGRLPGAARFQGARAVARREFMANLRSLRMVVVTVLLFLAIVGSAAGFTLLGGGGTTGAETGPFIIAHPSWPDGPNGLATGVVFVTNVWGEPRAGFELSLRSGNGPVVEVIGNATTDADGFAYFPGLSPGQYAVAERGPGPVAMNFNELTVPQVALPLDVWMSQKDASGNGSSADILVHATGEDGAPLAGAEITLDGAVVATLDGRGFAHIVMPPGTYEFELTHGGSQAGFIAHVNEPRAAFLESGATVVLLVVAGLFIPIILPIVTIAVAHDAIARERVQGSLDAVLSRPTTRYGVLLGKFLGVQTALMIPVFAAVAVGAAVIGALSGKAVDGAFFASILVAVTAYIAAYTLLLLILSTVAKTTGTAVMFGIMLWIIYNFFWGVIVFLVTSVLGLDAGDRAYYDIAIWASMFNLNELYGALLTVSFPGLEGNPYVFQGQEIIPKWGPAVAFALWIVALFAVALWVFDRKAAE